MRDLTTNQKDELRAMEEDRFTFIGHAREDFELTKDEFIEHEKKIQEYLKANGRYNN